MGALGVALQNIKGASTIGDRELKAMDAALAVYHETLGRFGAIFSEYVPPEYEEMAALKRGMAERIEVHMAAQACLNAAPPNLQRVTALKERYDGMAGIGATNVQAQVESALRQLYQVRCKPCRIDL